MESGQITLAAATVGDYTGAGIDWSVTCTYKGTSQSTCGTLYSNNNTTHSDSYGTVGDLNSTIYYQSPYMFQAGTIVTITATSTQDPTKSVSANITMLQQPITVAIQGVGTYHHNIPNYVVVKKSIQLSAEVDYDPFSAGASWSVSCGTPGSCGSFSNSSTTITDWRGTTVTTVTYTAPATVPGGDGTVTITASSATEPSVNAQANIPIDAKLPPDGLLNGNFVLLAKGLDTNGYFLTIAGTVTGDGNGNIMSQSEVFVVDSEPNGYGNYVSQSFLQQSTYNIGSDGRGTLILHGPCAWSDPWDCGNGGDTYGVNYKITFSLTFVTPTHALIAESDGFGNATGTLDLQNATDLAAFQNSNSGLNGTYTLIASGAQSTPANQFFLGSAMTFNTTNGTTKETGAVGDESVNGVVTANTASTSLPARVYSTNPDQYGHMFGGQNGNTIDAGVTSVKMDGYMIDANHFAVIGITSDGQNNFAGYLVAQPATPALSGTYGFIENGASATAAPLAVGGVFTCGSTGTLDVVGAGAATTDQPITAACVNPTTAGRGTIAISGAGSTGVNSFAVYPTVDSNLQLIEIDASSAGPVGTGVAYPQTAASPAASIFDGSYGVDFVNYGSSDDLSFVGLLASDGASALAGTVDENDFQLSPATASPTTGVAASGSFTAGANGRFTGSLAGIAPTSISGAFYVLSNNTILFLETDDATPGAGVLELQNLQ
jgi:hypothetical protein